MDDMYDGLVMLHRGVVGHPLWLNGLTHCQRVDGVSVDDMYDVSGVLLLHRGVVGHPLWLYGLTHCQRAVYGVSLWMICMMSAHGVLLLHRGVVGHPLWLNGLTHCQRVDRSVTVDDMYGVMASCCFTGEWWGIPYG